MLIRPARIDAIGGAFPPPPPPELRADVGAGVRDVAASSSRNRADLDQRFGDARSKDSPETRRYRSETKPLQARAHTATQSKCCV